MSLVERAFGLLDELLDVIDDKPALSPKGARPDHKRLRRPHLGLSVQAQPQVVIYGPFERFAALPDFLIELRPNVVVKGYGGPHITMIAC
jgi:hypothetical protein